MNSKKQKGLIIENGELRIRNRALEDQLTIADNKLNNQTANVTLILVAFKQYIRETHNVENAPMSDDDILAILNKQISEAAKQLDVAAKKETTE